MKRQSLDLNACPNEGGLSVITTLSCPEDKDPLSYDLLNDEPVITRQEAVAKIGELRNVVEKADNEIARLQSIAQVAKQSQETVAAARKALEKLRTINLKTATLQQKAELVAQIGVKIYPSEDFTCIRICFGLNITEPRKVTCYKTSIASPKL